MVIVGGVGLLLRSLVDGDAWSPWAELLVGLFLIGVGFWAIYRAGRVEIHDHPHSHSETSHKHLHTHDPDDRTHHHAALDVGLFRGMSGSGHLIGVLPTLALPTTQAVIYLVAYLVAAVGAMSMFAHGLGVLVRRTGSEWITKADLWVNSLGRPCWGGLGVNAWPS